MITMSRNLFFLASIFLFVCRLQSATSEQLEAACRSQLRIIHEALTYYREATDGELPNQLGELVGDYLAPEILHCPAARLKGATDSGNAGLIDLSASDGRIRGYKWELAVDSYVRTDTKGRPYQWMDFKKHQLMTAAGEWVPLVRCEHHMTPENPEKRVNLAAGGAIYESKLYWESLFTHLVPFQYNLPDLIEYALQPLTHFMPKRSKEADSSMVDLRPYANAMLEHPWIWGNWGEEMDEFSNELSNGIFSASGVNFDVSGIIQLGGKLSDDWEKSFVYKYFPEESKLIEVPQSFKTIHVLGGVVFASEIGAKVAFLELISKDGVVLSSIPWEYGFDVIDMFHLDKLDNEFIAGFQVVWTEDLIRRGKPAKGGLIQMEFRNPVPDENVAYIRLKAGEHFSSPFIAGLTLE